MAALPRNKVPYAPLQTVLPHCLMKETTETPGKLTQSVGESLRGIRDSPTHATAVRVPSHNGGAAEERENPAGPTISSHSVGNTVQNLKNGAGHHAGPSP